jgi:hypothetical protein
VRDFEKIAWKGFNKPPYYQQWLTKDATLKLATFGDKGLCEIDAHILSLINQWDLDNEKGLGLDRIGKLLVEPRNGLVDDDYRILLKLCILLNNCTGTVNDIIKVIKFLYSSDVVHIMPNYPAAITIKRDWQKGVQVNYNKIIKQVIGAGIGYDTKEIINYKEHVLINDKLFGIKSEMKLGDRIGILERLAAVFVRTGLADVFKVWLRYNGMIYYDGTYKYNGKGKMNDILKVIRKHEHFDHIVINDNHYQKANMIINDMQKINEKINVSASISKKDTGIKATDCLQVNRKHNYLDRIKINDKNTENVNMIMNDKLEMQDNLNARTLLFEKDKGIKIRDEISISKKYHRKHDGTHKADGTINFDGGITIPLQGGEYE